MSDKQYFSVIKKDKMGALLRNADTRIEKHFPWKDIEVFFIEETPRLYSWNTENPFEDEINKLSKKMNEDMGALIGRAGSTARAIRTLTRIVGLRNNARVNLKIEEPEGGRKPAPKDGDEKKDVDKVVEDLKL